MLPLQQVRLGVEPFSPAVTFRATATTTGAVNVSKPAGAAVGDLVVVLCGDTDNTNSITTSSGSAWSSSFISWNRSGGAAITSGIFWKVLDATDVANTWASGQSNDYVAVAYSGTGALSAAVGSSAFSTGSSTTVTIPGFSPSAGSKGVVSLAVGGSAGSALTGPSGFVERTEVAQRTTCRAEIDDIISAYFGTDVTWGFGASTNIAAWLLELR